MLSIILPSSLKAAAIIPEEENSLRKTPNGIVRRTKNSYSSHFSFSYNDRYNAVGRWTWDGYKLFGTIALVLYLLQGPPEQVFLALVIIPIECLPQLMICVTNVVHWGGCYERTANDYFAALVDVPLSVWYLTFYPDPNTKWVVVGKILVDSFHATAEAYGSYINTYLYYEEPVTEEVLLEIGDF